MKLHPVVCKCTTWYDESPSRPSSTGDSETCSYSGPCVVNIHLDGAVQGSQALLVTWLSLLDACLRCEVQQVILNQSCLTKHVMFCTHETKLWLPNALYLVRFVRSCLTPHDHVLILMLDVYECLCIRKKCNINTRMCRQIHEFVLANSRTYMHIDANI